MTTQDHHLTPGNNCSLTISSRDMFSSHRLIIVSGQTYHFAVSPTDLWFDMGCPTNANGFNNVFVRWFGKTLRVKEAKCFALCGILNENKATAFVIGTELRKTFSEGGVLSFFANDVEDYYGNNFGKIMLEVLRLK